MKTRREMCVFILWLMLAPLAAWLGSTTVHAAHPMAQAREHGNIAGEWQGVIARLHVIVKIGFVTRSQADHIGNIAAK